MTVSPGCINTKMCVYSMIHRFHGLRLTYHLTLSSGACVIALSKTNVPYKLLEWEERQNREAAERADRREQVWGPVTFDPRVNHLS